MTSTMFSTCFGGQFMFLFQITVYCKHFVKKTKTVLICIFKNTCGIHSEHHFKNYASISKINDLIASSGVDEDAEKSSKTLIVPGVEPGISCFLRCTLRCTTHRRQAPYPYGHTTDAHKLITVFCERQNQYMPSRRMIEAFIC